MLTTFSQVTEHISDVTPEQIGKCHRVTGLDHQDFYLVENERGDVGEDGQIIAYKCSYNDETGFSCACPSGVNGFWNVRNLSGVCKHCRWMVADMLEAWYLSEMERAEKGEPEEINLLPEWYNPANKTSYSNGTRALLIRGKDGKEIGDHAYLHHMLEPPKIEGPRPLPPMC